MKVLHVLGELRPSGAEVMLRVAAAEWRARGYKLEVLSTGRTVGSFASQLEEAGYTVRHLPFSKSAQFAIAFLRLLKENQYDVVHLHTERAHILFGILARLAGCERVVRTVHNAFRFEGILRLTRGVERGILRLAGVTHVAVSRSVHATEWNRFRNITLLIPNWYDANHFCPPTLTQRRKAREAFGIREDELTIVTVGNCSPIKNHSSLLEALSILNVQQPLVYVHVGIEDPDGSERLQAQRLDSNVRVIFTGYLSDPRSALWAADVYAMPSLHEGLPIAALEALGAGLPAVLTDVPGLEDFKPLGEALAWSAPSHSSLQKALERMLGLSHARRIELGMEAHRHISIRFGAAQGTESYHRIYVDSRAQSDQH